MPSSVVQRFHYDRDRHILRVVYVSGMVYDYQDVPEAVYLEMKTATSKGEYLNYHIKGKYPFKKVS